MQLSSELMSMVVMYVANDLQIHCVVGLPLNETNLKLT